MNWRLLPTDRFERMSKWYRKKRTREFNATADNLQKLWEQLEAGASNQQIMAGNRFLHAEQAGVIAVDQRGGAANLAETRLYVYPEYNTKILYLLTIGDKNSQSVDVLDCGDFVRELRRKDRADGS